MRSRSRKCGDDSGRFLLVGSSGYNPSPRWVWIARKWTSLFLLTRTNTNRFAQVRNEVRRRPGQEASLAPRVRTWGLSEGNLLYWRKNLWNCWDFSTPPADIWRPPQWFGAPIMIWRPGNCAPLAPPSLRPWVWNRRCEHKLKTSRNQTMVLAHASRESRLVCFKKDASRTRCVISTSNNFNLNGCFK